MYKKGEINKNIYIVVEGAVEIIMEYDQNAELESNKQIAFKNNQEKFKEKY